MTDNEIIKALECCIGFKGNCRDCLGFKSCKIDKVHPVILAIDLINRQKAEIERLQKELNSAKHYLSEMADDWEDWDD